MKSLHFPFIIPLALGIILAAAAAQSKPEKNKPENDKSAPSISEKDKQAKPKPPSLEPLSVEAAPVQILEPSGLAFGGMTDEASTRPLALCIDDDVEAGVFVLQASSAAGLECREILRFDSRKGNPFSMKDPASIAYNDSAEGPYARSYCIATSCRKIASPESKLVFFTLKGADGRAGKSIAQWSEIPLADSLKKLIAKEDLRDPTGKPLHKVRQMKKSKRDIHLHPFPFEIEGLAIRKGKAYMGLKWPLRWAKNWDPAKMTEADKKAFEESGILPDSCTGDAMILEYDLGQKDFTRIIAVPLGGLGISALPYWAEKDLFLAAANPPHNPRPKDESKDKEVEADRQSAFGKSRLYSLSGADIRNPVEIGAHCDRLRRPDGKLEGVAVVNNELWISFDGQKSHFDRIPLKILFPGPEEIR